MGTYCTIAANLGERAGTVWVVVADIVEYDDGYHQHCVASRDNVERGTSRILRPSYKKILSSFPPVLRFAIYFDLNPEI